MGKTKSTGSARDLGAIESVTADKARMITLAHIEPSGLLFLGWSDGTKIRLDPQRILDRSTLADTVEVTRWGHGVAFENGAEIGADRLWLETLAATGRQDTRQFLEWRLRHGLSLTKAAEALGLSRRMIAYYSNGEKPVPRAVQLACTGWEVVNAA